MHRALPLVLPALLAAGLVAARRPDAPVSPLAPQAPVTWQLTHVGREAVPLVIRGSDGRPLMTIRGETLVLGPGDRAERVTTMRMDAYDRMPCDMLQRVRASQRPGTPPPVAGDTSAAACEALRTNVDTVTGSLGRTGTGGSIMWTRAAGDATSAGPAVSTVTIRGDTLELSEGGTPTGAAPALRYVRRDTRR